MDDAHLSRRGKARDMIEAMRFDGHVAVVTGATRGVGRGVASVLAQSGGRVFITGRSVDHEQMLTDSIVGLRCDHRDDAQVDATFARIAREAGTVDVLVNNVWGGYDGMIENGAFTWARPF